MTRRCSVLTNTGIVIPIIMLFAMPMLTGCGGSNNKATLQNGGIKGEGASMSLAESAPDDEAEMVAAPKNLGVIKFTAPTIAADSEVDIPKKIIKEGTIRYSVRDYKRTHKELIAIIARNGGEIISEQENRSDVSWETQLEIRVPSARFDSCLNALAGVDETLLEKNIDSKDVTEEYVDMSARMRARKEVEQRYLDILKQAKTVEDILKVEEQLKTIREEVEAAQGRLQYIDHNVSMSAIHLFFYQTFSNTTPQGPGFFSRLFFSIKDGWNGVLGVLISFVGMWPLWLVAMALFIILRRYTKRRRLAKATA
jgi:hypothetical protein